VTSRREQTLGYVILGVFSLFALLPIVGILLTALQDPDGVAVFGSFDGLHFGNFKTAWEEANFGSYIKSSLIVSITVVVSAVVLSVLAGYAFGLMRFRGSTVLFYVFLLGLMVPTEAIIVPLYYEMRDTWHLQNTYWSVILPQIATSVAFGTYWMRTYFRSVPRSLVEAARIDGASPLFTLVRVLLPLARPAVLTMAVLLFMWTWNEFLLVLVMITDDDKLTAPLGLSVFQGRNTSDLTLMAAASVMVALPVVIVYLFLQRHFIRGMLAGAVKG
jgi:raffinose/stachyose/melibiose transport system permease protein